MIRTGRCRVPEALVPQPLQLRQVVQRDVGRGEGDVPRGRPAVARAPRLRSGRPRMANLKMDPGPHPTTTHRGAGLADPRTPLTPVQKNMCIYLYVYA